MKTREQIIAENPLEPYLRDRGIKLIGPGVEKMCLCPVHQEKTPSCRVNVEKNLWQCFGCNQGGSIIDLMSKLEGLPERAIMKRLGEDGYQSPKPKPIKPEVQQKIDSVPDQTKPKLVKTYDYKNAKGELVYQACRMEPKSFRQRRPAGAVEEGKWFWNMEGVERVLYKLPMIRKANGPIVVTEGEKDADNVFLNFGFIATTNVGGAGKWLDSYSDSLIGKDVILCGDTDKPGKEHMAKVLESLAGKAKTVRVVTVPHPFKDVSDWIATLPDIPEERCAAFAKLVEEAPMFERGITLPVHSMAELEAMYIASINRAKTHSLDFTSWIPTLGKRIRPVIGGEVISVLAGTGVGKSAVASNIAYKAAPLITLFFQQELPGALMFERSVSMGTNTAAKEVYHKYKSLQNVDWRNAGLNHIYTCLESRLTTERIEELIVRSELKIGERPALVIVDYIQLMGGKGERYERVSDAAEGLKAVAKTTNTVILIISQISRKKEGDNKVSLSDGKESGAIENSSGVVIGMWRTEGDDSLLTMKVLKNTKGQCGGEIPCNFDGERLIITERTEQDEPDQPYAED